jgi:hypothetical protein
MSNRAMRLVQDPVRTAMERIARRLPPGTDTRVVLDFLEDDLREGLSAIGDVEAHFIDVLNALGSDDPKAGRLLDAAGDLEVLQRLEYLLIVASQLRRRLCQIAGQVGRG